MANVLEKTIERYVSLWNKLETSGVRLDTLDKITFTEFKTKTNLKSKSQFNLAKALARNPERQEQINQYLDKKAIPKTKIKRTPEIQAIPKVIKEKPKKIITEPKFPRKEGQYGVVEVIDSENVSKWIKYNSKADFERQLEIIEESYSLESYNLIFHGFGIYTKYTEREYKDLLQYT